jgi:integrase
LRQGELLGLRWGDLDLAAGTLRVERQLQRLDGAFRLVALKTPRSRRTIAIPAILVAQLREHRARQEAERELVFPSTVGTPLDPRNLTRRDKALLARAGLPSLRFHDLRHTCTSLPIPSGCWQYL